MQIVIDISEKIYDSILDDQMPSREQVAILVIDILKGIVLPKKHGRLIDGDSLKDKCITYLESKGATMNLIESAMKYETILEATESEVEE